MSTQSEKPAKKKSIPRAAMPEQAPEVRRRNFEEVPLGYTKEMAMAEASRCLQCKNRPVSRDAR
jgi:glutamate synthase (NADPH/NADH) small chain